MRRKRSARNSSKRAPLLRRLLTNHRARPRKRKRPGTKGKRPRSLRRAPQSRGRRRRKRNMPRRRNRPHPRRKRVRARRQGSLTKPPQANLRLPLLRKDIGRFRQRLPPRLKSRRRNRKKMRRGRHHRIHQLLPPLASRRSRPSPTPFQFPIRKRLRSPSRNRVSRKTRALSLLPRRHRAGLVFGRGRGPVPLRLIAI